MRYLYNQFIKNWQPLIDIIVIQETIKTFALKTKTTLFIIAILISGSLAAQNIRYNVVKGSKTIGSMDINRIQNGNSVRYDIKNDVEFTLLFSFTSVYWLSETFENGLLQKGDSHNLFNGRKQKYTNVERVDGKYYVSEDGVRSYITSKDVSYTVSNLYFTEPVGITEVFSQWFGKYLTMKKIGDHFYEMTSPDGVNTYKYKDGICTEVKVSRDFATFYFKIQEESFAKAKTY